MSLHSYIDQHKQTISNARTIIELFEAKGINGVVNTQPYIHQCGTEMPRIVFGNLIQCAQDSWKVRVDISHFSDLSESSITVCLDYTFPKTRHREAGTAVLKMTLAPYLPSSRSAKIVCEDEEHLRNAFQIILFTQRKRFTPQSQDIDSSIFWEILERLVRHTSERNQGAPAKRRTKASSTRAHSFV